MFTSKKIETIPGKAKIFFKCPTQVNTILQLWLNFIWRAISFYAQPNHNQALRLQSHWLRIQSLLQNLLYKERVSIFPIILVYRCSIKRPLYVINLCTIQKEATITITTLYFPN